MQQIWVEVDFLDKQQRRIGQAVFLTSPNLLGSRVSPADVYELTVTRRDFSIPEGGQWQGDIHVSSPTYLLDRKDILKPLKIFSGVLKDGQRLHFHIAIKNAKADIDLQGDPLLTYKLDTQSELKAAPGPFQDGHTR